MPTARLTAAAVAVLMTVGCGGGNDNPAAPDGPTVTVTITSAGVSPKTQTIAPGTRITFQNNDGRSREMTSNPHPDQTDCPALNVGTIAPGQSRTSQPLNATRTCGFHDHSDPENVNVQGSVTVQ
jgi:hypothetical protein